jgi:hypothetical protein
MQPEGSTLGTAMSSALRPTITVRVIRPSRQENTMPMPTSARRTTSTPADLQREQRDLMERARALPGVAETMDLYRRTASQRTVTRVIRSGLLSDRTNP